MSLVRLLMITLALLVAITLSKQFLSKPADAKKTGKSCLFCHTKYGSKELTKAGKYYKEKDTLDGFEEKSEKTSSSVFASQPNI